VDGDLSLQRRFAFDGQLYAALAAVTISDAVVETELDFLLDIPGEIIGGHPRCMDVERRVAARVVLVDHPQLRAVPGGAVAGAHQPALAGGGDGLETAAEGEVDQLDIMAGDVGPGISADDPLRELSAGDALG